MDNATIAIIATAVLTLSALLWTVLGTRQMWGPRHLVRGIGLTLLPLGLWFSGIMELLVEGAKAVYRFIRDAGMDTMMITGLSLIGLGVLLYVISGFISPRSKEDAKQRRLAARGGQPAAPAGEERAGLPRQASAPQASGRPAPARKDAGLSDEDAEIEALLKRRGIE